MKKNAKQEVKDSIKISTTENIDGKQKMDHKN